MITSLILGLLFAATDPNSIQDLKSQLLAKDAEIAALRQEIAILKKVISENNIELPETSDSNNKGPDDLMRYRDAAKLRLRKAETELQKLEARHTAASGELDAIDRQSIRSQGGSNGTSRSVTPQQAQRQAALNRELRGLATKIASAKLDIEKIQEKLNALEEQLAVATETAISSK